MQYDLKTVLYKAYLTLYGTPCGSHTSILARTKSLTDPWAIDAGLVLLVVFILSTICLFYAIRGSSGRRDDIQVDQTNATAGNTTFGTG
jgi:hypothetical protein